MVKIERDVLEKMAMDAIDVSMYYDLLDSMSDMSDEELQQVIDDCKSDKDD